MFAASMDITRAVSSSPGAAQGELHLATHGAGFHFSFQIAFKEEMKLKIQENRYSSWSKKKNEGFHLLRGIHFLKENQKDYSSDGTWDNAFHHYLQPVSQ